MKSTQTKTVGLFKDEVNLHYVDSELVIASDAKGPQVILRNGSRKSLSYALKMAGFRLQQNAKWLKRPDGLSYHSLEMR